MMKRWEDEEISVSGVNPGIKIKSTHRRESLDWMCTKGIYMSGGGRQVSTGALSGSEALLFPVGLDQLDC